MAFGSLELELSHFVAVALVSSLTQADKDVPVFFLLIGTPPLNRKGGKMCIIWDDHLLLLGIRALIIVDKHHSLLPILRVSVQKYD